MYVVPSAGSTTCVPTAIPGSRSVDLALVVGGAERGVGPRGPRAGLVEVLLERDRHAGQVVLVAGLGAAVGDPLAPAGRPGHHHAVPAGLRALDEDVDEVAALRGGVGVLPGGGGEPALGLDLLVGDLLRDRLDAAVEQPVADLLEQQPADHRDHQRAEHQRARDHPGLDGAAPERQPAAQGAGDTAGRASAEHGPRPSRCRPCSRPRGRSPRSRGSPGRARPWSAAAARAR